MPLSQNNIENLLIELEQRLRFHGCEPVSWIICGGSALNLLKLNVRTTRDIDLLGEVKIESGNITVVPSAELPQNVQQCVDEVAKSNSLPKKWVNFGPAKITTFGLPEKYQDRLVKITSGSHLTIYVLGRLDLIALKLYAAGDDLGRRQPVHLTDLKEIKPTYSELEFSLEWIKTLPDHDRLKPTISDVLEELGYGELAYYF